MPYKPKTKKNKKKRPNQSRGYMKSIGTVSYKRAVEKETKEMKNVQTKGRQLGKDRY
jgi:hypothetical protein